MNCFEWKYRLSDYLDQSLPPEQLETAQRHADSCLACKGELKRVRAVIHELKSPARAALPTPIRRKYGAPDTATPAALKRKKLPWYVRLPVETLAILFVIVSIIEWSPKIGAFLRGRALTAPDGSGSSAGLVAGAPGESSEGASLTQELEASSAATAMDDIGDEEEEETGPVRARGRSRGEIWRYSFHPENPIEQRRKVSAYLGDLDRRHKLALSEESLTGLEVPGGVQFQAQIPDRLTDEIKAALEQLGTSAQMTTSPAAASKGLPPFAWYKTRSRQPVPEGMARIVIWIPQI